MDHISEFAHKWEFGTSEFYAVYDFHNLQCLYGQIGEEYHSELGRVNGEANMSPEDRKNVVLQRIVFLEHTIEQNSARIPGYASAYLEISSSFQDMIGAAAKEARAKFPTEEGKQTDYTQTVYNDMLAGVYEIVFEKQNPNI